MTTNEGAADPTSRIDRLEGDGPISDATGASLDGLPADDGSDEATDDEASADLDGDESATDDEPSTKGSNHGSAPDDDAPRGNISDEPRDDAPATSDSDDSDDAPAGGDDSDDAPVTSDSDDGDDAPVTSDSDDGDDAPVTSDSDDGDDVPVTSDSDDGDDVPVTSDDGEESAGDQPATSDDMVSSRPEELADEIARLRAETAALQRQLDEVTAADSKPTKRRPHHTGRWWGSTVCLVLGAILLPIAVIGRWTSTTLLDTETYVATVTPLAENEDIQEAIAFRVSEVIVDVIDVEALVRDDLPPGTRFLAGPIEAATRSVIDDVVRGVVSTDAFVRFWAEANRIGHEGVVAVFTGEGTDLLDTAGGRVVLKVGPLVQGVVEELDDILDLDLANSIPEERLDGEFVIVDSDDLASLQDTIRLFDQLSVIVPILTLALFAASIYLARPRRLGFRNVGAATVISMALCVLLYTWVRGRYIDGLPDDIHNPDAAAAFFDVTTRLLMRDFWVVLVIGVIILFFTWLVGPTGWAGRARAWWKALISKEGARSAASEIGEVPRWVARHERNLLWTTFVLGVATLLLWTLPTGTVVVVIAVIVVLVMSGIHVLAEIGRKADADIRADEEAAAEEAEVEAAHADAAKLAEVGITR